MLRWFDPDLGWRGASQFPDGDWCSPFQSAMAFDGTGRAVVLWDRIVRSGSFTTDAAAWSVLFDGAQWQEIGRVSHEGVLSGGSHLGMDSQGRVLGIWGEPDRLVFARFNFATGWESPQTAVVVSQAGPQLAVAPNGQATLVWRRWDSAQNRDRIEASAWNGESWGLAQDLQATSQEPQVPSVIMDSCGRALVVWAEVEGDHERIWANRSDAACGSP
jgi:hypothetical protein